MNLEHVFPRDVCVIGGGGHVGLPLALTFAELGAEDGHLRHQRQDGRVDPPRGHALRGGGRARSSCARSSAGGLLEVSEIAGADERVPLPRPHHRNPGRRAPDPELRRHGPRDRGVLGPPARRPDPDPAQHGLSRGSASTSRRTWPRAGSTSRVAFCPERVAQGHSLREFRAAAADRERVPTRDAGGGRAGSSAASCHEFIEMAPMEAELCKLMTNASRYIQFAIANQFYTIAEEHGLDFDRILHGCRHNYPRMAGMPGPGFAAGPVPAQGHDAARRVQPELVSARTLRDAGQRGAARAVSSSSRAATSISPGRSRASSAWRSRPRATTRATP